ncbi:MAG TPA: copper oxidase, partial [Alphaproteobacteria bacterium]|nr:copper oxidase [Alphaproteobacteria bacterium]
MKWGLITTGGLLAPIHGLNPFVNSAYGSIPTGANPSPLFGAQPFSQAMPRFDLLARLPIGGRQTLSPTPTAEANQTLQPVDPLLGGGFGPIEGRPPGPVWAHQAFAQFPPQIAMEATQQGNKGPNTIYNPGVASNFNSGINPATPIPLTFHPNFPVQAENSVWTFNGTVPPKLAIGRYSEPILFRHHNGLPADVTQNNGFGRNTISTHEHNGHHGAENDGFTGAFFFPNQFYDYHWPIKLGGFTTINTGATDPRASTPDGSGGLINIPGDWRETMSTHWFHDHMFSFTSQNVYKGNAAMFNIYSGLDRGNEGINDGVNLRLPSGTLKDFGNLEYDVNLLVNEKAFDASGQLYFDIFDFDGFLGDVMCVNLAYKPYFEVEHRKYRFRILNGSVSRFFKICCVDATGAAVPIIQIANDGNLLPTPVTLTQLDEQGIAERYDIVIDFTANHAKVGDKFWLVNLCEHQDGKKPSADLSIADALAGKSNDPCIGKFLEFRIVRNPQSADKSVVPAQLIPNPDLSNIPVARTRVFEFNSGAQQNQNLVGDPTCYFTGAGNQSGPWGVRTDQTGPTYDACFGRISALPQYGTREVWTLQNGGGGWDHPIHIHFEEGQ